MRSPLVLLIAAVIACGSASATPPAYVAQPTSALERIEYPPPPARVETVPTSPLAGTRWIDGEWTWRGHRWLWLRGRWVTPPTNAKYSPWVIVRAPDGTLYEAPGTWRNAEGAAISPPKPLASAQVSEAAVVDAQGNVFPPGRALDNAEEPQ